MVEIIVGLLVWGGVLGLVLMGAMGWFRESKPRSAVAPPRAPATPPDAPRDAAPPPTPPATWPVLGETEREAGALVDGLIIGHQLTRTHYRDRLEDQAETIEALRADVASARYPGDDADPDDGGGDGSEDGFDGFEGFGSGGGFAQEAHDPDLDPDLDPELDGSDAGGDPWEDDIFGFDDDDD